MKKALLLFFVIPLLGITKVEEKSIVKKVDYQKRPTIEQQVQIKENQLGVINSKIKIGIAELQK